MPYYNSKEQNETEILKAFAVISQAFAVYDRDFSFGFLAQKNEKQVFVF